jgi:hypothetical protein
MRLTSPLKVFCFLIVGTLSFAQTPAKNKPTAQLVGPGQKVYVDPQTRQIAAPTDSQVQALNQAISKGNASFRPAQPTRIVSIYGIEGMLLDESTMSFSVASKDANGKVSFQCVESKEKAEKAMQQPVSTSKQEKLDDK